MNNYIGMKAKAKDLPQNLHMTVRFLGDNSGTSLIAAKNALQRFHGIAFPATVIGKTGWPIYNEDGDLTGTNFVYLLGGEWLEHFCSQMHEALNRNNIIDRSEFDWTPHVTVPEEIWTTVTIPEEFLLGMLYVKWDGKAHAI